ncbi:unnamed protein product [Rotaria socialis]|uniref:Uncharacterized protein n=1 Tax=Rotaria socialis TaxID=392032 RepID=A0A821PRT9_9BILA|nr:unnamed protein product [Rotaria socialis]CAF4812157.1 unnamed protein product [Rotaria socialis]
MEPNDIFDVIGINIARCLNSSNNKEIILTTRETKLYIDAITGVKLNKWTNPYTSDTESVMHVTNDPVQRTILTNGFFIEDYLTSENQVVLPIDVYRFDPNPLFKNETLRHYSKENFRKQGNFSNFLQH